MKKYSLLIVTLFAICCTTYAQQEIPIRFPNDSFNSYNNMYSLEGPLNVTDQYELDEIFQDSIYYCSFPEDGLAYAVNNYFAGVRFTAPAAFELQGVRFFASDENVTEVEAYLYTDLLGSPGELIEQIWETEPTAFDENWVELNLDDDSFINLDSGENFWIIIGPVPGFPGWDLYLDDDGAEPGERSKLSWGVNADPANMNLTAAYDLMIIAAGEFSEEFFDLKAISLYNDIQRFHVTTEDAIEFIAEICNIGTMISSTGQVVFTVTNSDNEEVFSSLVNFNSIESHDTLTVSSLEAWIPDENDIHLVNVEIDAEDDFDSLNNDYQLFQTAEMYSVNYSSDELNLPIICEIEDGWAVSFTPLSYPANLELVSWYFEEEIEDISLYIWGFDNLGNYDELWDYTGSVDNNWNSFDIEDVQITEGDILCGFIASEDEFIYHIDNIPPVCANNPDMPATLYNFTGDSFNPSTIGDFPIRIRYNNFPPSSFSLIQPENNSVIDSVNLELAWNASTDIEGGDVFYKLYVNGEVVAEMWTDTTFTFILLDDHTYVWTVAAQDDMEDITFANETFTFSISIPEPPTDFHLFHPEDSSIFVMSQPLEILIDWEHSYDPDPEETAIYFIDFDISNGTRDTSVIIENLELHAITLDFHDLIGNWITETDSNTYVDWTVYAYSGEDTVASLETWSFIIEPPLMIESYNHIPTEYSVSTPYPNPFNPSTSVRVSLPELQQLDIHVFNILGEYICCLASGKYQPGYHSFSFNAVDKSSGIYLIRSEIGGIKSVVHKVVLIK